MIFADTLPKIKSFLRPARLPASTVGLLLRLLVAFFDRLEKEKEDLELQLSQKSAAYLRARKLRQADAAQVSAALPRGGCSCSSARVATY